MAPFIKIVDDLNAILTAGSNEDFFRGDDYSRISDRIANSIRTWCQKNLGTVRLKSEGAIHDDPEELYVIHLGRKKERQDINSLIKELSVLFVIVLSDAAKAVDTKNIMTGAANEAFDAVEEAARLRTLLLKVVNKGSTGPASAILLNVG